MLGSSFLNLVIVYEKGLEEHANYLKDLISLHDDSNEKIMGVKDGSVKAIICEDKKFEEKNNTSEQKIVCIGKCKGFESTYKHAKWKIDEHGLKCGWFGNKAVLFVDGELKKKDDYDKFFEYGTALAKEMNEQLQNSMEKSTGEKVAKTASILSIVAWVYVPFVGIPGVVNLISKSKKHAKQIKEQQYDTLVRAFYLKHCQDFIEGKV